MPTLIYLPGWWELLGKTFVYVSSAVIVFWQWLFVWVLGMTYICAGSFSCSQKRVVINQWSIFDIFWILTFIRAFALNLGSSCISDLVQFYLLSWVQLILKSENWAFVALVLNFFFLYCYLILDSMFSFPSFNFWSCFDWPRCYSCMLLINHIHLLNAHYSQISSSGICFIWKTYRQVRCFLLWSHASGVDYWTTTLWLF